MNRTIIALLAAGIVIAAAGVLLIFFMTTEEGGDPSHFSAYEAGDEQAASAPGDSPNEADGATTKRRVTTKKVLVRKEKDDDGMLKLPDDELNRPGPTGAAAEARRIKNRRPRTDEEAGKQDDAPTGELAKEDVRKGIQAVSPLVKVCYEETLEEFPDAAGKVTVEFRIIGEDGKGRVEMTELAEDNTTLFDQRLHDCMQKSIAEAEFETPSGGAVNVRYPFVFRNDNDED